MSSNLKKKLHGLYVANKLLPENDYRVLYPAYSKICRVSFVLPGGTTNINPESLNQIGFGEGFRLSDILNFFKLLNYLRKTRNHFDFVHFYSTTLILLGPIIAWIARIPCIITVTGFGRTFTSKDKKFRFLRPTYLVLLFISFFLSRAVLLQNYTNLSNLSRQFPYFNHKFFYAGSGVDFHIYKKKNFNDPCICVILIARIMPDKGIEDFLEVASILFQKSFEFKLIGPISKGFDNLFSKVKKFSSEGKIHYLGELTTENIQNQLQKAHILYFPSLGEGMSRVMLEAGFAQVCPIAYDIPANRDLIEDGRGFLVPVGGIKQTVSILEKLNTKRDVLSINARAYQKFIVENYPMEKYAQRMDIILAKLFPGYMLKRS